MIRKAKRHARRVGTMKIILLALSAVIIVSSCIGGTVAWIYAHDNVTNSFTTAKVTHELHETMEENVKEDVSVKNTGNIDTYIRVALIPAWTEDGCIRADLAVDGTYEVEWGDTADWRKGGDGYYYYTKAVAPGEFTTILIKSCKPTADGEQYDGMTFTLDINVQSIQATPDSAVREAWGQNITASNGTLTVAGGADITADTVF
ncbi:MAG: hypothetical protein WCQ72_00890 [Eubacteriales bacterium]